MTNRQRTIAILRTHAYLVRLIISLSLMCAFIISSVFYFSAIDLLHQATRNQQELHQHAEETLASMLDDFVMQLQITAMQIDSLPDQALSPYLRGAEYSQDVITRLCVYQPETQMLIGSAGEESLELLAHTFFPSLTTQQFLSLLTAQSPAPFAEQSYGMLAFPIRTDKQIVLYILNGSVLRIHADSVLPRSFSLLAITDAQGTPPAWFQHLVRSSVNFRLRCSNAHQHHVVEIFRQYFCSTEYSHASVGPDDHCLSGCLCCLFPLPSISHYTRPDS